MRIGIDFDNTIVSYDGLFHKVALEEELIPPETPVNKLAVRDYLRNTGREDRWTEMQGYVYGKRMDEAEAFPGVIDFMGRAAAAGHVVYIVSHKTRHPFLGPQYDLHAAARAWIENHLLREDRALLPEENIYFELTKQDKLARIAACGCEAFIDDLPEILLAAGFPPNTSRMLFDAEGHHSSAASDGLCIFRGWAQLSEYFIGR